jgi:hypothetical protein
MMRKRLQIFLLTALLCLSVSGSPVARAADYSALRHMLERVPDTDAVHDDLLSYLDLAALIDSRKGAAHPHSIADWIALDQDTEAAGLYRAVQLGIGAGVPEIIQNMRNADAARTATGIDIYAIDRMLTGIRPPATLNILEGSFSPALVEAAYAQRDYQATTNGDFSVLCPPAGCDTGLKLDLKSRNPANPFGGRLGRLEPIAVSETVVLNSPAETTLNSALAVQGKPADSLAANADYLSVTNTAGTVGTVLQAYFIPAPLVSDFAAYMLPAMTEQEKQIQDRLLKDVKPIPQYSLALIAHVARENDQAVIISLVYTSEADANIAAQELPARLNVYQSVRVNQPFMNLITERGGTLESTDVVTDTETGKFVVIMKIAAPFESSEKIDGKYVASGLLFRLFYTSLVSRDMAWLITQVPQ